MSNNDFKTKSAQLPQQVKKVLLSNEITEIIFGINTSYGLNSKQREIMAQIVGQIFVNNIPINRFLDAMQKNIDLPQNILSGVALLITKEIFFPLKEYFSDLEPLINQWRATAASPKHKKESLNLPKEPSKEQKESSLPAQAKTVPRQPQITKKDIKNLLKEFPELWNQLISAQPIKIADFNESVRPSVKNWLKDYIQQKGTGHHSIVERSDYLYRNPNAQKLNQENRRNLNNILKSYDENTALPFSLKDEKILFEDEIPAEQAQAGPRIEGNVIDLKNN